MFYDHFGSLESDRLLTMMRYMAASGCRFIVLDHISIVVSGLESHDERKDIDILMTKLASFVQETGVGVMRLPSFTSSRSTGKNFQAKVARSASTRPARLRVDRGAGCRSTCLAGCKSVTNRTKRRSCSRYFREA